MATKPVTRQEFDAAVAADFEWLLAAPAAWTPNKTDPYQGSMHYSLDYVWRDPTPVRPTGWRWLNRITRTQAEPERYRFGVGLAVDIGTHEEWISSAIGWASRGRRSSEGVSVLDLARHMYPQRAWTYWRISAKSDILQAFDDIAMVLRAIDLPSMVAKRAAWEQFLSQWPAGTVHGYRDGGKQRF